MLRAILTVVTLPLALLIHLRGAETQEEQDEREFIDFCDEIGLTYNEGAVLFNNVADLINEAISDD